MPTQAQSHSLLVKPVRLPHRRSGACFEGVVHLGPGGAVIEAVARTVGRSPLAVIGEVVKELLVKKGADWTTPILGEYLGLYAHSGGTFCLISEKTTGKLVAHAVVFQSTAHAGPGLLAHVRTADGWGGYGLGTLVTGEVTRSAFGQGASVVVLDTDDKLYRKQLGERAAFGLYGRLGYAVLAQKEMPDAQGWLMVIDAEVFARCQRVGAAADGEAAGLPGETVRAQEALIAATRRRYSAKAGLLKIDPVGAGDLAGLFLLLNLCPPDDFRIKLASWGIVQGPEFERAFVVGLRPGILDRDRLEDASLVLRDPAAGVVAVCAARQALPLNRQVFEIDFYCLPQFLGHNRSLLRRLVEATIARIGEATDRPRPCRLLLTGTDPQKLQLFAELGFVRGSNVHAFHDARGTTVTIVEEYEKTLG